MINIRVDEPAWIGAKFDRKQIEKYQGKLLFLYLHIINNSTFVNNNNVYSNVYLNIPHICDVQQKWMLYLKLKIHKKYPIGYVMR